MIYLIHYDYLLGAEIIMYNTLPSTVKNHCKELFHNFSFSIKIIAHALKDNSFFFRHKRRPNNFIKKRINFLNFWKIRN